MESIDGVELASQYPNSSMDALLLPKLRMRRTAAFTRLESHQLGGWCIVVSIIGNEKSEVEMQCSSEIRWFGSFCVKKLTGILMDYPVHVYGDYLRRGKLRVSSTFKVQNSYRFKKNYLVKLHVTGTFFFWGSSAQEGNGSCRIALATFYLA
jgi:hypothetical protein